jgi:hypothetical protein
MIKSNGELPTWEEAFIDSKSSNNGTGSKMFEILDLIQNVNEQREYAMQLSGRSLTQLPETSIMRYLRDSECDLEMALNFIRQQVLATLPQINSEEEEVNKKKGKDTNRDDKRYHSVEIRGKKRKFTILLEQDCDEEFLNEVVDKLRGSKEKDNVTSLEKHAEIRARVNSLLQTG